MQPLDADTWRLASPYLDIALELQERDRAAWLEQLKRDRPAIAPSVELLLDSYARVIGERFLDEMPEEVPATAMPGRVGGYRLMTPIGHGGMGSVWLAERSDGRFAGRAAIKFLNAGLIGHAVQGRFTREASILARLAHPHIAHLIDAGVSEIGQPYLVLEYVDGEPIDRYCDANRLSIDGRVRLFLDVLTAVAHAHAHLIVHRDLKPSNVLVTGEGSVKLLDFGVAKLIDDEAGGGQATEITRAGGGALTPAYAAPEQVAGGTVTTATDVYALGVLLYVLLAGRHPLGPEASSPAALLQAVATSDARPLSVAGRGVAESTAATLAIATARVTTVTKLPLLLKGDLETIVAKALKKNPAERYATVPALADDLRRYLADQPIEARPDAWAYRAAKFARRNRTAVALTSVAVLALASGIVGTLTQARRATEQATIAASERDFAMNQLTRAEALNDLNTFLLTDATPSGTSFTAGELLGQAERVIERQHAQSDDTRVELMVAIGRQYWTQDEQAHARRVLEAAYDQSAKAADPSTRARAACALASASDADASQMARAEDLLREGLARLGDRPQDLVTRVYCYLRGSEIARRADRAALGVERAETAERLLQQVPSASLLLRFRVALDVAESYRLATRNREANAAFAVAADELTRLGYENTETAETLFNNWALVLSQLGRPLEAEAHFRRAVQISSADGTDQRVSPFVLNNMARTLEELGRYSEASEYAARAYTRGKTAGNQRLVAQSLIARAASYRSLGDLDRAESMLRELAEIAPRVWPPDHSGFAALAMQRSALAQAHGQLSVALEEANRAVAIVEPFPDMVGLPRVYLRRADVRLHLRQFDLARADAEQALALLRQGADPGLVSCEIGRASLLLAQALAAAGGAADARRALATAVEHLRAFPPDHPDVKRAAHLLARGFDAPASR